MFEESIAQFAHQSGRDLGHLLARASSAMSRAALTEIHRLGHHEIRPSHIPLFAHIDAEGTTITTLAERAAISRQAMSVIVKEVESLGYISTTTDAADRRALRVTLTALGARLCEDAARTSERLGDAWIDRVGADDVDTFRRILQEIATAGADPDPETS